jgi:Carboxypeptidase regulatory-like domain
MRAAAVKQWVCNRAYLLLSLGVVLAGLTSARSALAQVGAGTLTGQVTDAQDRKPLADVVVTATSPDLQGEQVVVTDSSGLYRIPSLPAGTYSIHFEKDGYKIIDRTGIALRTDATLRVDAPLLPESLKAEEVVVTARAPTVDVGSSAIATTITKDFTSRIPVAPPTGKGGANRSIEAVAEVVPGAQGDDFGVSFAGASSPENSYLIDGLNVGNPGYGTIGTPLSIEFVKELSVITGGYMPEYGRTTGGMLSAITKSGSNELHGNVFANFAPGGLAGTPTTPPVGVGATTSTSPLDWIGDVGGDVGGPIAKDKLWFYAGFDVSSENYSVKRQFYRQIPTAANLGGALNVNCGTPGNPACPQTERILGADQNTAAQALSFQAIAKLTWAINENNKLTGTFVASPTRTGGAGKFSVDPKMGGAQLGAYPNGTLESTALQANSQSYDASLRWSSEFSNKRVLLDTTVGFHHEVDSEYPSDGSQPGAPSGLVTQPNVTWTRTAVPGMPLVGYHSITEFENNPTLNQACSVPASLAVYTNTLCPVLQYTSGGPIGQNSHLYTQTYNRYSANSTLTYLLQFLGHHIIKAGVSVEVMTGSQDVVSSTLSEDAGGGFLSQNAGFGVLNGPDNPIQANPLHIKTTSVIAGGFLQDSWSIMDVITANFGVRYDAQQLFNGLGQTAMSLPDQWSPRLGVIYDPTQSGRAKIYANYARYFESVPLALANDSLVGQPNVLAQFPGPGPNAANCNSVPPNSQSCTSLQPNTNNVNPPHQPSQTYHVQGQGVDSIDPNVKPTTEDDFVAGAEYEIFKDARAGISYQRRWLVRWLDDMSNDATGTFFLGNPGYNWASGFPQAERTYDGGTLYLTKTFGDEWLTSASYTLSYLRGNISGLFIPGEFDPNHNASFDTKAFTINQQGPLAGDRTHQVKLFGAKDWAINPQSRLSTGLSFRAMSGTPINYEANDVIYGCCGLNLLLPRGSGGRTPWEYDVDVNLGYRFSVNKDTSLTATVDIFNLFNFQEVTTVNMQYTQQTALGQQNGTLAQARLFSNGAARPIYSTDKNADFLLPTFYQSPRYFRFGIRGTF